MCYRLCVLIVTTKWQNDLAATWPIVPFQFSVVEKVIKSDLIHPDNYDFYTYSDLKSVFVPCVENRCSCSSLKLECLNVCLNAEGKPLFSA